MPRVVPVDASTTVSSTGCPPQRQTQSAPVQQSVPRQQSTSSLYKTKPRENTAKGASSLPKPGTSSVPSQDRVQTKVSWRSEAKEELAKKQTIIFILCLGLLMVAVGAGITYYAVYSGLQDFFIIGPGSLVLGTICLILACFFIINRCLSIRKRYGDQMIAMSGSETLQLGELYATPQQPPDKAELHAVHRNSLYGKDDVSRARRLSAITTTAKIESNTKAEKEKNESLLTGGVISPTMATLYEEELGHIEPPKVALPQDIRENTVLREESLQRGVVNEGYEALISTAL